MTVDTGGPLRGLAGRWLMRFEASSQIIRLVALGVTAASTFTSALALLGFERYAAPLLAVGVVAVTIFAFVYVELGIYNRKNRERHDRGDNYSSAGMAMSSALRARQLAVLAYAVREDWSWERTVDELDRVTVAALQEYRDGVDLEAVFRHGDPPATRPRAPEAHDA